MDPFTLFLIGSTVLTGIGSLFKGFFGASAAGINKQILAGNAALLNKQVDIALGDAQLAYSAGALKQSQLRRKVGETIGAQVAGFAAGGLDPTRGSPLLLAAYSAGQGETDAQIIATESIIAGAKAKSGAATIAGEAASQLWKVAAATEKQTAELIAGFIGAGTAILHAGAQAWPGLGAEASTATPKTSWGSFEFNNPWSIY